MSNRQDFPKENKDTPRIGKRLLYLCNHDEYQMPVNVDLSIRAFCAEFTFVNAACPDCKKRI